MAPQPIRPSRWYYLLSLLVIGCGVAIFFLILFKGLSGIPAKLTQMEAPGTSEMTFAEPGTYTIFYEHRSVVEGRVYDTGGNLSGLRCTVVSGETGAPVSVVQASGRTSYALGNRAGRSILEFSIDRPGLYQVSATYSDNSDGQRVVLAIGLGVAGTITATVIGGLAAIFGSILLAGIIASVIFVKRRRAKKALTWSGYPPPPQAFSSH